MSGNIAVAAFIALSLSPPSDAKFEPEPTVNLSAVRMIICKGGYGSGFMINDNLIATAGHVAGGTNCYDRDTLMSLTRVAHDAEHDFALMTGNLPDMPVIKYSCEGYKPGWVDAYGYSSFHRANVLFRQVTLKVGKKEDVTLEDGTKYKGLRGLYGGYTVPGMSGGPHIQGGFAVGMTNSGSFSRDAYGRMFIKPEAQGFELKDTILCSKPRKV